MGRDLSLLIMAGRDSSDQLPSRIIGYQNGRLKKRHSSESQDCRVALTGMIGRLPLIMDETFGFSNQCYILQSEVH